MKNALRPYLAVIIDSFREAFRKRDTLMGSPAACRDAALALPVYI